MSEINSRNVLTANIDPKMLEPVECRALRAFYVDRKLIAIGEYCTLPRGEAISLAAIKKLEIL